MKKFLLILFSFLCASGNMDASNDTLSKISIATKDGVNVEYLLEEQPVITFTAIDLVVTTTKDTVTYPLESMAEYKYVTGEDAGIIAVKDKTDISFGGGTVLLSGLPNGSEVNLYSVKGECISSLKVHDNVCNISLTSLQPGIYVIKAYNSTFKFIRK